MEGSTTTSAIAMRPAEPSPQVGITFTVDDPTLDETWFWQQSQPADSEPLSEGELTDEAEEDSYAELTRVSTQEFRFCQRQDELETQRLVEELESETSLDQLNASSCPQEHSNSDLDSESESELDQSGIVVLPDIDDDEEEDSSSDTDPHSVSSDSNTTLPTSAPPADTSTISPVPVRTCKAPKNRRLVVSITGGNTNSNWENQSPTRTTAKPQHSPVRYISNSPSRTAGLNLSTHSRSSCETSRISHKTKHTLSSGRSRTTSSASGQTVDSDSTDDLPVTKRKHKTNKKQLITKTSKRMNTSPCLQSLAEESTQLTVATRWQKHCENLWTPLFFDLWDTYDAKDDETLATFDEELSYEDEGNVDIRVAVQATVLGTQFPEALDRPSSTVPHVYGSNFVGVVQPPRGDTVHSRKFPPGCRVASISAWSAPTHKPYIVCNTSNLLPVPPLDGLHLDGTEVSVLAAAYLPAFQALHHGQRNNRHLAYKPTALEGQRILIMSHSNNDRTPRNSMLNQSLVDAQVQAAVRMALLAGARDVHVTVNKIGNSMRKIFGNDYRVRLLDSNPEEWIPRLRKRMDVILDFTGGFSFGRHSTSRIVEQVMCPKTGRYVGFLGESCSSPALDVSEEAPIDKKNRSTWSEGLSLFQVSPGILPEGKDIRHVMEWTAICMNMQSASLFDFYGSWKQDRRLAEHDFRYLLELLAKRHIRPHVAKILDVDDFPSVDTHQTKSVRPMSGAIVCEPWDQFSSDDSSTVSG